MLEFFAKLSVSTLAALIAYYVGVALDAQMAWWVAGLIGLTVGFGGWFIIVNADDDVWF